MPSSVGLETLESTWAYAISFQQYCLIRDYNSTTASLMISLFENYLIHTQKRIELFRYNSVEDRIDHYLKESTSLFVVYLIVIPLHFWEPLSPMFEKGVDGKKMMFRWGILRHQLVGREGASERAERLMVSYLK